MKKELATALALLVAVCSFSPLRMAGAGRISPVGQERKDNPAISPENARRCVADGRISYQDFGARGDGKTDDLPAIVATHTFANAHGLKVKAADNAVYYLGGRDLTADIRTDTDFGSAVFLIDDTQVENRNANVFSVTSALEHFTPALKSLRKGQPRLDVKLPDAAVLILKDSHVMRYIRRGVNRNNGSAQTDVILVDKDGNVDPDTPVLWDFDRITEVTGIPVDPERLTLTGGKFRTIANRAESKYTYYQRGIKIERSNVLVEGLEHTIRGEGDHGAPYAGFLNITSCANVTVRNTRLTGHKMYVTTGASGDPSSMGSYDIGISSALNVTFVDCTQTNDITDRKYWGILGSNYSKNLLYDGCVFSRFDAHMGVANATIRNSTLGHQGINAIGSGVLRIEGCTILADNLVNLRADYGSTWQGEFIIRDCVFVPRDPMRVAVIGGRNDGQHDFGYVCHMPRRITLENLLIVDPRTRSYRGPALFGNFNSAMKSREYVEPYPYVRTEEVILKNVSTRSGLPLRISDNALMFKDVKITESSLPNPKS